MTGPRPTWVEYDGGLEWAPDLTPNKHPRSVRWTGAAPGDLVEVSYAEPTPYGLPWLPGVYFGDGRTWNGTGWLWAERAYDDLDAAKRAALRDYHANRRDK